LEEVIMIPERDPALRYKIEEQSDRLLELAGIAAESIRATDLKSAQVKGLLRQTQTGYGVEHVRNWLRYQKARVPEWQRSGLADAVLADINTLKKDARTIADTLDSEHPREQLSIIWLALVRRYVAYLARWYPVVRKKKGAPDEDEE
jgi:hypothetical protein